MRTPRLRPFVLLLLVSLTIFGLSSPGTGAAQSGILRVSPEEFVGGQMLTFSGNLGASGVRKIHLEAHLGRSGDSWTRLPGSTAKTNSQGDFSFGFRAPSMFNIKYRAASGSLSTDPINFQARSQDLVLELPNVAVVGRPFSVTVDTTPELARRPDTDRLPAFPGREVRLQERRGSGWQDVATTVTDRDGLGVFSGVVADQPGPAVYRAVQEDWRGDDGLDRIGAMPSFPTFLNVQSAGSSPAPASAPRAVEASDAVGVGVNPIQGNGDAKTDTASEVFGWRPALWDFAWLAGESLASPPYRGKGPLTGWWLDSSTGTGRAAKHNGGLELDSQRANVDSDTDCLRQHTQSECLSAGTTAVVLQDASRAYGRWEVRVRAKSSDSTHRDFRSLIELVPAADPDCAAKTITVADIKAHSSTMKIGVNSGKAQRRWKRGVGVGNINNVAQTIAVEVSKKRITWFRNGRIIGSLRNRSAVPGVPLTLQLRQKGVDQQEMNRSQTIFDWMRGYDLSRGAITTKGSRLGSKKWNGTC